MSTKSRGGTAKFLALLSSLAMIMIGLVGVAFASPASADTKDVYLNQGYDVTAGDSTQDCVEGKDGWLFIVTGTDPATLPVP